MKKMIWFVLLLLLTVSATIVTQIVTKQDLSENIVDLKSQKYSFETIFVLIKETKKVQSLMIGLCLINISEHKLIN